ncbi:protein translocase subunit SecD [Aestuariivirga sp. YIM B02566]|uniref:Protein translocase subunit SecD n=1 Tax=Taklimakanibacter albus TaxID=2800327 RepID=A0ACC5R249_9HYPH|nr:protein translocase subunit SecD [Aestuariivirga sp. YIM B02566]MBK1866688.1 protein translocase subunit SecD [Aestuariivirga sp. YIM B02566]
MLYFSRWKVLAILASIVVGIAFALPNVLTKDMQDKLREYTILRPLTLGLDLQGGSNVLMEVDRKELINTLIVQQMGDVRAVLREARIGYKLNRTPTGVAVQITDAADTDKANQVLRNLTQPLDTGLFGTGVASHIFSLQRTGQQFVFSFNDAGLEARVSQAVDQSLAIIDKRVNGTGIAEVSIQRQGKDRIAVQLPGVGDPDQVVKMIGQTAKLTFQLVCESQPAAATDNPPPDCAAYPMKAENAQAQTQPVIMWVQTSSAATVDGADLNNASSGFDSRTNEPIVSFKFNQKGALRFGKLTADNVGKPFAIILDQQIISAPRINEPILGGTGQISGNFTVEEANSLAIVLRSGALPARLIAVEQRTVGPSLGSDSIRAGAIASVIALIAVMCFMLIAYGLFGIFANVALIVNLILLIGIMSVAGFTLTLPGIAGIVLTMGIAVDSNVLVYERIREEWRHGRSAFNAIETGFRAALATVLDSNITSFIAAVVLFGVGSGPVRGFAIAHAIGIITTVFTAFTVTRLIVFWWVRTAKPKEVPL